MEPNNSKNEFINLDYFIRELDGNPEIICLSINNFISMLEEYFGAMKLGIKGSDWELIHRASHKMKPSIQMFGLEKFYEVHSNIVEASRNIENIELIPTWHQVQKDQYPAIVAELHKEQEIYCNCKN